jgi:hypothetical protein
MVNNGVPLARAGDSEFAPNKLLERDGERLDDGTAHAPGVCDQTLATVGTRNRASNGCR